MILWAITDEHLETIGRILAVIIGTSTVLGIGAKYVLLPWIKSNLVEPVREVNKQVTVNNNVSDPATMLDTVHHIEDKVDGLEETIHKIALDSAHIGAATGIIRGMWDHHLEWSAEEVRRLWNAIESLQNNKENKHE